MRAAEDREQWKDIVTTSPVVSRWPSMVKGLRLDERRCNLNV